MIRAFVGLPVPEDVCRTLEGAQVGLKIGKLVPPENFHLTLAFLGEHPETLIEDVHDGLSAIRAAAVGVEAFGLGMFGDAPPRAIFADVTPVDELKVLRKKVRQAAREYGIALHAQRFHPHITLARFNRGLTPDDAAEVGAFVARNSPRAKVAFRAESFCLYRSFLGGEGPIYEVLAEYPLSASVVSSTVGG
ncbi:MAG: RNA 2',3'-cyclic phosphodiesterase [Pseudomonadota bacterium]